MQTTLEHTEPLTDAQRVGLGVNRGVTFGNGKVFRGYDDGNVVAIDAKSGKAAWSTPIANHCFQRFRLQVASNGIGRVAEPTT